MLAALSACFGHHPRTNPDWRFLLPILTIKTASSPIPACARSYLFHSKKCPPGRVRRPVCTKAASGRAAAHCFQTAAAAAHLFSCRAAGNASQAGGQGGRRPWPAHLHQKKSRRECPAQAAEKRDGAARRDGTQEATGAGSPSPLQAPAPHRRQWLRRGQCGRPPAPPAGRSVRPGAGRG